MGGPGSGRRPNGVSKNINTIKKKNILTLYKRPNLKQAGRKNGIWIYNESKAK